MPGPGAVVRARWAALVAVGAGLAGVLAFPRFGWWPLAFVSVAGLCWAVHARRARTGAWLGYLYGLAFTLPLLHWTGVYVGAAPWLILCAAMAAFFAVLGALLTVVQRLRLAPAWIACAWVLQEFLRDRLPFGGFPWGRLAFSQAESPLRWFAALGGAPLVSFAVALCGAGLFQAARSLPGSGIRVRAQAAALGLAVAVPVVGALIGVPLDPGTGHPSLRVALIQGGLPDRGLAFEDRARQVLDNHVKQTLKLAAQVSAGTQPRPDIVLWPENSSDVDPILDPAARAEINRAARAIGAPILVGAIRSTTDGRYRLNVGILWSPTTGPGAQYVKRHPVPFGEYIPLRGIADWVSSAAKLVDKDMIGGHGNGLVRGGPVPFGDVICFEVAYDGLVRSSVAAGARFLVVQTNNATFGHTAETYQQLAMSQLRAVETGRPVLQVATTGKSAVIAPDGSVQRQSGALYRSAILTADIAPRTATTLAVRLGAIPEYVLTGIAVVAAAASIAGARRARRPVPQATAQVREEEMVQK
jgi:apolipoprotein N-acyltransferase